MQKISRVFAAVLLGLSGAPARADEVQLWGQLMGLGKVGPQLRLWLEAQPRYSFDSGAFTTAILRPGVGWQVTDALALWVGYAWQPRLYPTFRDEHRLWLQATHLWEFQWLQVAQRARLEARLFSVSEPAYRLRYQARVNVRLLETGTISAVVYDEVFVAFNDASSIAAAGFDQNRLFVGVLLKASDFFSADVGYLWNAVHGVGAAPNRTNHVLMTTLYFRFGDDR